MGGEEKEGGGGWAEKILCLEGNFPSPPLPPLVHESLHAFHGHHLLLLSSQMKPTYVFLGFSCYVYSSHLGFCVRFMVPVATASSESTNREPSLKSADSHLMEVEVLLCRFSQLSMEVYIR